MAEEKLMDDFARRYNPSNPKCIEHLRSIDGAFEVSQKLGGFDRPADGFLLRLEVPFMHFVRFVNEEILCWLPQNLHEIIDGESPHRMYFDIESKLMENEIAKLRRMIGLIPTVFALFNQLIELYRSHFIEFIGQKGKAGYCGRRRKVINGVRVDTNYTPKHLGLTYAFYSHRCEQSPIGPIKFSCHLICPHFIVQNYRAANHIARGFAEYLRGVGMPPWLDLSIYKRRSSFRCAGSSKRGENRPLILTIFQDMPSEYFGNPEVYVQQCQLSDVVPVKYKEIAPHPKSTPSARREICEVIFTENAELLRGYEWDSVYDFSCHILRLRCHVGTQCLICERAHRKTEGHHYVLNVAGGAFFRCSHPDAIGKGGVRLSLGNEVESEKLSHAEILKVAGIEDGEAGEYCEIHQSRYISAEMARAFRASSHLAISSPMGSGKTHGLGEILMHHGRDDVVMVSFRVAFTLEKAKQLGLGHYQEEAYKGRTIGASGFITNGIIIQAESLRRLSPAYVPKLVICDEIESIFDQFAGIEDAAASREFHRIISKAPAVIFMDANLTKNATNYMAYASNIRPRILINNYKASGLATIHKSPQTVWGLLLAAATAGERVAYCSGSKGEIDELSMLIGNIIGPTNVLKATGETREVNEEAIKLAGSAAQLAAGFQVVLYNTTWVAGIDLVDEGRKKVFAVFDKEYIGPFGAMQLVGRVRGVAEVHFYAKDAKKAKASYLDYLARACGVADHIGYDPRPLENTASLFAKCMAKHLSQGKRARQGMRATLIALFSRHGFDTVQYADGPRVEIRGALNAHKTADAAKIIEGVGKYIEENRAADENAVCRYNEAAKRSEAGQKLIEDFRIAPQMPAWQFSAKCVIEDVYKIGHDDFAKLTAEEVADMRAAANIERQKNINLVRYGWENIEKSTEGEAAEYSAENLRVAEALRAARIVNAIAGDTINHMPSGRYEYDVFHDKIAVACSVAGINSESFDSQLKSINARLNAFGFKYRSGKKKRIGGVQIRTDYFANPHPSFVVCGTRLIHKAVWRLELIAKNKGDSP
jgi:hypothetical protein